MKLRQLDSFLNLLSLMFRKYFLDMGLSYEFSESGDVVEVSISRVEKDQGPSLVPSAIFSITETSVRFLKLDFDSDIDFVQFNVHSLFELRLTVLSTVYRLVAAEHEDLTLYEYLSRMLTVKVESAKDLLGYLCKVNDIDYFEDDELLYIYDYGNFKFYDDAISFLSSQSVRVIYKIDTELSAFGVVSLVFDSVVALLNEDPASEQFVKVFAKETPPPDPTAPPEDDMGAGGFGDFGGMDGADSGMGGGGGSNEIPVEGGSEGSFGGGGGGFDGGSPDSFEE